MRCRIWWGIMFWSLWISVGILGALSPSYAVTVEAIPVSPAVEVGDSVQVDLVVSGLGELASPSLGAFDLTLCFDPEVLDFLNLEFGPHLGDEVAGEALTGWVVVEDLIGFEVSLLLPEELVAQQPSSFTLLSVTFNGSQEGISPLDVIANAPLSDEVGGALPTDTVAAAVSVRTLPSVPEIPTLSQWGLGGLALLLMAIGVARSRMFSKIGLE